MQEDVQPNGIDLIKRSTWLGTKMSFLILAPICVLIWLGFIGLIIYKSVTLQASPLEIMRAIDAQSASRGSSAVISTTVDVFVAAGLVVVVGVAFSTIVAAAVGVLAAGVQQLRR